MQLVDDGTPERALPCVRACFQREKKCEKKKKFCGSVRFRHYQHRHLTYLFSIKKVSVEIFGKEKKEPLFTEHSALDVWTQPELSLRIQQAVCRSRIRVASISAPIRVSGFMHGLYLAPRWIRSAYIGVAQTKRNK